MYNIFRKKETKPGYSRLVGCIYVFNLIVGTGALALPRAFQQAGLLLGGVILTLLCFLSYVTSTYVIETMSISNGLEKLTKLKYTFTDNDKFTADAVTSDMARTLVTYNRNYGLVNDENQSNMLQSNETLIQDREEEPNNKSYFEINDVYEMGQMAIIYYNRVGLVLFYLSMCIYLYGDLAIYASTVATTIRDVACTYQHNETNSSLGPIPNLNDNDLCWPNTNVSRMNSYRIFLAIFVSIFCPFVFFNLTKTKLIQYATVAMRWLAFAIMIALMSIYLARGNRYGQPKLFDVNMFPSLLGSCVYSFMCHHSLPSMVTPIRRKGNIYTLLFINFSIILLFYSVLSLLASFTFGDIQSLITFNFEPNADQNQPPVTDISVFRYYLSLFPVFSISASFPIIGITLRNNLKNLITCGTGRKFNFWFMEKMFYPLLAIVPTLFVVFITNNIKFLVEFTGLYAGSCIQYIIPITLALCARRNASIFLQKFREHSLENTGITEEQLYQPYQSPFKHTAWSIIILIWSFVSIILCTINYFLPHQP